MPILLILIVAVIAELAVLIWVGRAIGVLLTLGLLVLTTVVGIALLRRQGARTLLAFREAVRTRRPPHRELIDGMLLAVAGVFIVVPGFISDVIGLLLLLPPVRALVRRRMLSVATAGAFGGPAHRGLSALWRVRPLRAGPDYPRATGGHARTGEVIEGEVIEGEIVGERGDEPPEPRTDREQR